MAGGSLSGKPFLRKQELFYRERINSHSYEPEADTIILENFRNQEVPDQPKNVKVYM